MTDHVLGEEQRVALTTVLTARDLVGGIRDDANLERRAARIADALTLLERALSPEISPHLTVRQIAAIERTLIELSVL